MDPTQESALIVGVITVATAVLAYIAHWVTSRMRPTQAASVSPDAPTAATTPPPGLTQAQSAIRETLPFTTHGYPPVWQPQTHNQTTSEGVAPHLTKLIVEMGNQLATRIDGVETRLGDRFDEHREAFDTRLRGVESGLTEVKTRLEERTAPRVPMGA